MPDTAMHDLARVIQEVPALEAAGVPAHLRQAIEQAHTCTWATHQGIEAPTATTSGSKAGDPLGDVLFLAIFA
eukprot:5238063-Lingulodinium_polyedra.AAC.1